MSRAVSIRDIDPSLLGPNSPIHELRKVRAPMRDLEHQEQVKLFEWAAENETVWPELRWLFAVPNFSGHMGSKGARLNAGRRLKAEGRKPGVLDVWFPVKRSRRPGLVIEMKIEPNHPTAEQHAWIKHLIKQGWKVEVAYSADAAISIIVDYLNG